MQTGVACVVPTVAPICPGRLWRPCPPRLGLPPAARGPQGVPAGPWGASPVEQNLHREALQGVLPTRGSHGRRHSPSSRTPLPALPLAASPDPAPPSSPACSPPGSPPWRGLGKPYRLPAVGGATHRHRARRAFQVVSRGQLCVRTLLPTRGRDCGRQEDRGTLGAHRQGDGPGGQQAAPLSLGHTAGAPQWLLSARVRVACVSSARPTSNGSQVTPALGSVPSLQTALAGAPRDALQAVGGHGVQSGGPKPSRWPLLNPPPAVGHQAPLFSTAISASPRQPVTPSSS